MIEYLQKPAVMEKLANGYYYRKREVTLLRIPVNAEIGKNLVTYVKSSGGVRKESDNIISKDHIIARNDNIIGMLDGAPVYNEWAITKDVVTRNYGQDAMQSLDFNFSPHKKKSTVQAIELTRQILDSLSVNGSILEIKVSWSNEPMIAHIGDYITSAGYSISKEDMASYEII